jgi:hypothetical protein
LSAVLSSSGSVLRFRGSTNVTGCSQHKEAGLVYRGYRGHPAVSTVELESLAMPKEREEARKGRRLEKWVMLGALYGRHRRRKGEDPSTASPTREINRSMPYVHGAPASR